MILVSLLGWIGTISLVAAGFPQIYKVIKEGNASGMHLWYIFLIWFGLICMALYVLLTTISIQLLCSYGIQFIVFSIFLYRKIKPKEQMLH
jgi:uncharacterized protein with PQ loop repeat